ncbi:hypothetical protein U9M48_018808 [Paspalum notatum var. saurae]|uniref:Uncharacterized protein n=1 Tax=Paspalum notatum var. saurae TaxID=547442 RepID=A0AAQ3TCB1_PASNO
MELGIGPEKLVPLTSKSVSMLSDEKLFGNDPDNLRLRVTSMVVKFLFWKILDGIHSRKFSLSLRILREVERSRDTSLVSRPNIASGIGPPKPQLERLRWRSSVSRSNPTAGSCEPLKLFQARFRCLREVRSKSAGCRPPLCSRQPPRSRVVTRPSASPQPTPFQRQQSVSARHDHEARVHMYPFSNGPQPGQPSVEKEKELFSRSSAEAWSGRQ